MPLADSTACLDIEEISRFSNAQVMSVSLAKG